MSSGYLMLRIRNTNGYGNDIWVDNINITRKFKRDLATIAINQPKDVLCTASNTPSVTVQNVGSETVTSYTVSYRVDNGAVQSTTINTPIAPNATAVITTLPAWNYTTGPHVFTAYTSNPVSASGTGDLNTGNDTLRKNTTLVATVSPPVVEGFENATFPPTGWAVVNPDNSITWARTTNAAKSGVASAFVNNYNYLVQGQTDDLYTPQLSYTGVDSVSLSFDVAAATYSYPGSTAIPLDTLQVFLTKDCGNTYITVYKKWGDKLQSISDPNYPQLVDFYPANAGQWRNEYLELTAFAAGNGPLQAIFRNTSNGGNNVFIDNVNLKTRTLPAKLKALGYLILPSPFHTQFTVWHYLPPTDLKYISVYNSVGQLVWRRDFGGNADKQVVVDLSNRSAGIYIVHLGYTDSNKNTSTRIVKY
jgi:hypothetical protein